MAFTREEIEDMLGALPSQTFRFDKVQEDALTYTGALRTDKGQNVVEPSPESASMIIALKPSIDFLVAAPQIVRQLLDGEPDQENKPEKPKSEANKPISV